MQFGAAELLGGDLFAGRLDDGRARREHLADATDHHGIVAGDEARRAEARDRPQPECHDGDAPEVGDDGVESRYVRHVGRADLLDLGDGATAAGSIEQPHERQAVFRRHLLQLRILLVVIALGRATAHGEIVGAHDDGPAVDRAAAARGNSMPGSRPGCPRRRSARLPQGCPIRGTNLRRARPRCGSRTVSLPRDCCRATRSAPPICWASARRRLSSSISGCQSFMAVPLLCSMGTTKHSPNPT